MNRFLSSYSTHWVVTTMLLVVVPAFVFATAQVDFDLRVGQEAPDFRATEVSPEQQMTLKGSYPNQVVLLYFWHINVPPSDQGLEDLQKLHAEYSDRLIILFVKTQPEVRWAANQVRYLYPRIEEIGELLFDTHDAAKAYHAEFSLPVSCVIDAQGKIAFYEKSFDPVKLKYIVSELLPASMPKHMGVWFQWTLPMEDLSGAELVDFQWGGGDVLGVTVLREGRAHWTFGGHLSASYQNSTTNATELDADVRRVRGATSQNSATDASEQPFERETVNGYANLSIGPPPFWHSLGIALSGGIAGHRQENTDTAQDSHDSSTYIAPVVDIGLRLHINNWLSLYGQGGVNLRSVFENGKSIFDEAHVYRYQAGVRMYIATFFNLNVGYAQWQLGDRDVHGLQLAGGIRF